MCNMNIYYHWEREKDNFKKTGFSLKERVMEEAFYLGLENNQIIMFADILGFSNLVIESENNKINDKTKLMIDLEEIYYAITKIVFNDGFLKKHGLKFLFVSDSVIISTNIDNIANFFKGINQIYMQLLCYGLALRGGISVGRLHHRKNIWGVPMVKAVKIESNISVMPRISISSKDIDYLPEKEHWMKFFKELEENSEYLYYDFFDGFFTEQILKEKDLLFYVVTFASQIRKRYRDSALEKHKEKWLWLADRLRKSILKYEKYIEIEINNANDWLIVVTNKYLKSIKDIYEILNFDDVD